MRKISQHTRFDKEVQNPSRKPAYYPPDDPRQQLLFPESEYSKYEEVPPKPLKPLKIDYPELKPEHISTKKLTPQQEANIHSEISSEMEQGERYPYRRHMSDLEIGKLKKYLDDNQISDVIKGRILNKYDELRAKGKVFYAIYLEANQLAEQPAFEVDTSGNYADFFRGFSRLLVAELTSEIGRLFGAHTAKGMTQAFQLGTNIFNITSLNFERKIGDMDKLIHYMDAILLDYQHRKKLIKHLGAKIENEIDHFLANDQFKEFLAWMDTYFPYKKDEFAQAALNQIRINSSNGIYDRISFGDLVKFKTFKSIYEKAQSASTIGFKHQMERNITIDVNAALTSQFSKRVISKLNNLVAFFESLDTEMSVEDKKNKIIDFCRKQFNIDLRAVFSFAQNVTKKRNEHHITENEQDKENPTPRLRVIDKANQDFIDKFVRDVISNLGSYKLGLSSLRYDTNWQLQNAIDKFIRNLTNTKYNSMVGISNIEKILQLHTGDIDQLANQFIYNDLIMSIPGFSSKYDHMREYEPGILPTFSGIRNVLEKTDGKFSIESFTNFATSKLPFVPKELLFTTIRSLFKELDNRALNRIDNLSGTHYQNTVKFIVKLLTKYNKLEHNSFLKLFKMLEHYTNLFGRIRSNLPKTFSDEEIIDLMIGAVRSINTMDKDLENLDIFVTFLHNEAGSLKDETVKKIISNPNFTNFNKVAVVRKLFKAYAAIKNLQGVRAIYKQYGPIITDLKRRKFLSPNFRDNLLAIERMFESNQEISPQSPEFASMIEASAKVESDLQIMQMGDALKELLTDYKPKDKSLFKLDMPLTDSLRFRVLKDKDPRTLRIGIETDCCQRIGGVGEVAARDSFLNPLSSVLILEWKNPEDNEWKLLSQSYFHYVPKENGYILDNIEENRQNVNQFKTHNHISLEEIYGIFAQDIKNKLGANYLLAGKGYSKISTDKFKTDKRYKDPRFFDERALTKDKQDHYSDYDERNAIDLLAPKFDVEKAKQKLSATKSAQHQQIRGLIKTILNPSIFIKRAQTSREDIRNLTGTNIQLFGPQSWNFINQIMNVLNQGLFDLGAKQKLGSQTLNFQAVIRNPSDTTKFSGGLRSLVLLSMRLWQAVSAKRNVYSVPETQQIANNLLQQLTSLDFPEPQAGRIKSDLTIALNNWLAILK